MNSSTRICRMIERDPELARRDEDAREHAGECAACRAYLAGVAELGRRLQDLPSSRAEMPAAMRESLLSSLGPEAGSAAPAAPAARSRRRLMPYLVPVAMAASLALGFLLADVSQVARERATGEIRRDIGMYIADVTHDHYLLERIGRPLEVALADPADLSDWLSGALNFDLRLPDRSEGFRLEGGRVWHTVGRLSALASYRTATGDRAVLFAVPAANLDLSGAAMTEIDGVHVFRGDGWDREARVWIEGDLALALVAPKGALPPSWREAFVP